MQIIYIDLSDIKNQSTPNAPVLFLHTYRTTQTNFLRKQTKIFK
jgi:hypothetical protein